MILEYHFGALLYDEQAHELHCAATVQSGRPMGMREMPPKHRRAGRKYPMQHAQGGCGTIRRKPERMKL